MSFIYIIDNYNNDVFDIFSRKHKYKYIELDSDESIEIFLNCKLSETHVKYLIYEDVILKFLKNNDFNNLNIKNECLHKKIKEIYEKLLMINKRKQDTINYVLKNQHSIILDIIKCIKNDEMNKQLEDLL